MAFITISELRPAGAELFQDSESYLYELNEQEVSMAVGGGGGDSTVFINSVFTANSNVNIDTAAVFTEIKTNATVGAYTKFR